MDIGGASSVHSRWGCWGRGCSLHRRSACQGRSLLENRVLGACLCIKANIHGCLLGRG